MYCPSCGIDSVDGLKYCKRCGVTLSAAADATFGKKASPVPIGLFLLVIVCIACAGLSTPLLMARDLINNSGFLPRDVMFLFFGSSVITIAIIALLVRVLLRLIAASQPNRGAPTLDEAASRTHDAPQINAAAHSFGSVTENTTRSFEQRRHDAPRREADAELISRG